MTTVKHLERLWNAKQHERLFRELLAGRPEGSLRTQDELATPVTAAAMTLLRLDELGQPHVPHYGRLLRYILAAQEPDGGWGDPPSTAICLRALLLGSGHGAAIDAGLAYLARMQKEEGIWSKTPIRRMAADAFASAFMLLQLGGDTRFRQAVHFHDAMSWFEDNKASLDGETRRLWDHAAARCRRLAMAPRRVMSWS